MSNRYVARAAAFSTVKNEGLSTVFKFTPALAAVLGGTQTGTRQDALKGVWAYIKANNLQDQANKRIILADAPLKAVFKQDRTSMYEVMKLMAPHISKQ
jgi:upstream activation factor subunit UAF30